LDAVVIGAGLSGLTAATTLREAGGQRSDCRSQQLCTAVPNISARVCDLLNTHFERTCFVFRFAYEVIIMKKTLITIWFGTCDFRVMSSDVQHSIFLSSPN